jgi:hypothetical protein
MTWFRAPLRLVDEGAASTSRDRALAAALRDWSAETGDAHAVARLERRLAAALAAPRALPARHSASAAWLGGMSALAAVVLLAFFLHESSSHELDTRAVVMQRIAIATGPSRLEMASRLGVGPRELAAQAAIDTLQPRVRR